MRSNSTGLTLQSLLDLVASMAVILAAGALVYTISGRSDNTSRSALDLRIPPDPLVIDDAPVRGSERAWAVMIVYADFQCPFCGRFARDVLPEIERRYVATGQIAVAFRHLPLDNHRLAVPAAVSAECAARQGQFWEVHDQLFGVETVDEDALRDLPASLGLDIEAFADCTNDDAIGDRVRASAEEARALGIRGTPTFLLGTRLIDGRIHVTRAIAGAQPVDTFVEQLDAVLAGESGRLALWDRLFSSSKLNR